MDERDNKDDRKAKNLSKYYHCRWRGHLTENWLSKECTESSKAADNACTPSTQASAVMTLTVSIEKQCITVCSDASSSDWYIDCRCTTYTSGHQPMFISYTEYYSNTRKVKEHHGVVSFLSGYGSVRFICPLCDGQMEMIQQSPLSIRMCRVLQ